MVRVKICGLTRPTDVEAAVAAGADALGFIAVAESPRFVSPETVRALANNLPPFVSTVAVARCDRDASPYPVRLAQLYADPAAEFPIPVVRVFRIGTRSDLHTALSHAGPILLDAYSPAALGGTGHCIDWDLAAEGVTQHPWPVILAGGLTPENVAEAVRTVRPYAVDVSSGVETSPGVKDHEKIRRFVDAVRSCR